MIERIARQYSGPWLRCYVRGKLWRDPLFAAAGELLRDSPVPVLDVGCGVGLFEFYLRECGFLPPLVGIDFDAGKIAQAQAITGRRYRDVQFRVGDVLDLGEFCGHVVLFDVLHYLPIERQMELLERIAGHIAPGALCLIRATPRSENWRFRLTKIQEFFLRASLWMKSGAVHYATVDDILSPFRERGFECEARPLWAGTPFNSHLFVLRAPL